MKVVYISGHIGTGPVEDQIANCTRATDAAIKLSLSGFAVICPHALAAFEVRVHTDPAPERYMQIMHQDIELLRRCDGILMLYGWEDSAGSRAELLAWRMLQAERDTAHVRTVFFEVAKVIGLWAPR